MEATKFGRLAGPQQMKAVSTNSGGTASSVLHHHDALGVLHRSDAPPLILNVPWFPGSVEVGTNYSCAKTRNKRRSAQWLHACMRVGVVTGHRLMSEALITLALNS